MRTAAQKTNIALQVALVESQRKRYVIARHARITPDRLSKIAHGHVVPSETEQVRIAAALDRPIHDLFPLEAA